MGAVGLKLDSAYRTQNISQQIKNSVPSLTAALGQMQKSGITANIAAFEKVFEDLDVTTESLSGALDSVAG